MEKIFFVTTPKEHIGLPNIEDVREGVIAARIAGHLADIARRNMRAIERDRKMSEARSRLDWNAMAKYALDSKNFKKLVKAKCENNPDIAEGCSMCGKYYT